MPPRRSPASAAIPTARRRPRPASATRPRCTRSPSRSSSSPAAADPGPPGAMAPAGHQTPTPDEPEPGDDPAALRRALAEQQRIEAELRATIAAQDQSFRKLSHRLKNNLQLVISIVSLRLSALRDEAVRRELEDVLSKIHALALIQ